LLEKEEEISPPIVAGIGGTYSFSVLHLMMKEEEELNPPLGAVGEGALSSTRCWMSRSSVLCFLLEKGSSFLHLLLEL
jgi:hypothetical protein